MKILSIAQVAGVGIDVDTNGKLMLYFYKIECLFESGVCKTFFVNYCFGCRGEGRSVEYYGEFNKLKSVLFSLLEGFPLITVRVFDTPPIREDYFDALEASDDGSAVLYVIDSKNNSGVDFLGFLGIESEFGCQVVDYKSCGLSTVGPLIDTGELICNTIH